MITQGFMNTSNMSCLKMLSLENTALKVTVLETVEMGMHKKGRNGWGICFTW